MSRRLAVGGAILVPLALAALQLGGCGGETRPAPVADDTARVVRLEDLPFAEISLPPNSRGSDTAVPRPIPLSGQWVRDNANGRRGWQTDLPIRPRGLFFFKAEPGIRLLDRDGKGIPYARGTAGATVEWSHDRDHLWIWFPTDRPAPEAGEFSLDYPLATERESALNLEWSEKAPEVFAWTTIQDDWDARDGLLLPAPGTAAWDLEVPPAAELTFVAGVVVPEIRDREASDGARLEVSVQVEGAAPEAVWAGVSYPGAFSPVRIDLSKWAGKKIRLRMRSDPSGSPLFDYLFVAEPAVASRKADPVRVLMVFVDTLRPDHMSLYGYHRDTTAALDSLASEARVFEQAYTVAPWTLPSARSIVTGRQPELYDQSDTVQGILGKKGWANAFFAGNVYLSVNFGMNRDWDLHRVGGLWPPAEQTTNDALRWLDEHEGRDAVIQVHYMDAHLPYKEPLSYRMKYAGIPDSRLGEEFFLSDVQRARLVNDPPGQQYIRDRYDNNIRYATDQIRRLVDTMTDNDVLLLYADHGEEFWDHGGYEHGHSLFQELVHVPLVIRAPGVTGGRTDIPVSLLDLTPTILDLVGEPVPAGLDGRSLAPFLRGEPGAEESFRGRDLGFGRPLYGLERWGVIHENQKWTTTEGREALYDLATDPTEQKNLLVSDPSDAGAPFRDALAQALGREVEVGYKLTPTPYKGRAKKGLWALCTVPGGFEATWAGADPLLNSYAAPRLVEAPAEIDRLLGAYQIEGHTHDGASNAIEVCWPPDFQGSREVYLVPRRPLAEVGHEMVCSAFLGDASGGKRGTMRIPSNREAAPGAMRTPLEKILWEERQLLLQFGIAPVPVTGGSIVGRDNETDAMLEQLGYKSRDGSESAPLPEGEQLGQVRSCEAPTVPLAPMTPAVAAPGAPGDATGAAPRAAPDPGPRK